MENNPVTHHALASPEFIWAYRMGLAVAAADMAERIGLVDYLNTRLLWDPKQCKVSPGMRLLALMIGFLVDPLALYRLEEFYTEMDCAVLFGAKRHAADFNDDAVGRALIKLFESQSAQIYAGLSQQAVERLALPAAHTAYADTTSLTLYGQYPNPGSGSQPAFGYNKDGHPECLQLVAGVVAHPDGIPMTVEVCDGNMDDPTWSRQAIMEHGFAWDADARAAMLFVVDSKLISHDTVRTYATRPSALCPDYRTRLVSNSRRKPPFSPEPIGNTSGRYRPEKMRPGTAFVRRTDGRVGDHTVRLIVVHSSTLEAKATKQETVRLEKEAKNLDRAMQQLQRRTFACQADAQAAWDAWTATKNVAQSWRAIQGQVIETPSPADTTESPNTWRIQVTRTEPQTDRMAVERFRRSTFIFISNDPSRSARDLLMAYKAQIVVEQDNALMKGPLGVAPLFLKDTRKINAYVYVVYLALLLWQCMQAVMRQNQERLGMSLPYPTTPRSKLPRRSV